MSLLLFPISTVPFTGSPCTCISLSAMGLLVLPTKQKSCLYEKGVVVFSQLAYLMMKAFFLILSLARMLTPAVNKGKQHVTSILQCPPSLPPPSPHLPSHTTVSFPLPSHHVTTILQPHHLPPTSLPPPPPPPSPTDDLRSTLKLFSGSGVDPGTGFCLYPRKEPSDFKTNHLGRQFLMYSPGVVGEEEEERKTFKLIYSRDAV